VGGSDTVLSPLRYQGIFCCLCAGTNQTIKHRLLFTVLSTAYFLPLFARFLKQYRLRRQGRQYGARLSLPKPLGELLQ